MSEPHSVDKYSVSAVFFDGLVEWRIGVRLDNGETVTLEVKDGSEIPVLLDVFRRDATIFFDPRSKTLGTGWNDPGA